MKYGVEMKHRTFKLIIIIKEKILRPKIEQHFYHPSYSVERIQGLPSLNMSGLSSTTGGGPLFAGVED